MDPPDGLSGGAGIVLEESKFMASPKRLRLFYFFYREVAPPIKHLIELLQRGDGAGEEPFQTNPIFI
jgi:hypothetical protein